MDDLNGWLQNASAAGFLPFELVEPKPERSELSGYGGGSGEFHLDFTYWVEGREIGVGTTTGRPEYLGGPDPRRTVIDAVLAIVEEQEPLVFPFTLNATFDVRTIEVLLDGASVTFAGVASLNVDSWTVSARLTDDTLITIHGRGDLSPVELRRRTDLAVDGLQHFL